MAMYMRIDKRYLPTAQQYFEKFDNGMRCSEFSYLFVIVFLHYPFIINYFMIVTTHYLYQ